jgi:hypothetical protein
MHELLKIALVIGAIILSLGALEIALAFVIIVYRMHLIIFTNKELDEFPIPRHVQVM